MLQFLLVGHIVGDSRVDFEFGGPAGIQVYFLLVDRVLVHLDRVGEGELVLKLLLLITCRKIPSPGVQDVLESAHLFSSVNTCSVTWDHL